MKPVSSVQRLALVAAVLLGALASCGSDIASNNLVYLQAQLNFQKSSCGERLSFYRIGGDGSVAGPQDGKGNFTIPSAQSLILTDIHVAITNSSSSAVQQNVSFYIEGSQGEVTIWSATVVAAAQSAGS